MDAEREGEAIGSVVAESLPELHDAIRVLTLTLQKFEASCTVAIKMLSL